MYFKTLTGQDVVQDVGLVTSGIFQDGASSITAFHTSSTQHTNTGDYSIDVFRYDPGSNASASVQFGVAFGNAEGSGSLGTVGATGDRGIAIAASLKVLQPVPPQFPWVGLYAQSDRNL